MALDKHVVPQFRFDKGDEWPDLDYDQEHAKDVVTTFGEAQVVIRQKEGYFSCCEPWNDHIESMVRWNGNEITNIGHDFDHPHWPIIQDDLRQNFYYAPDLSSAAEYVIELLARQLGDKFWVYELDVADRDCTRYQEACDIIRTREGKLANELKRYKKDAS